MYFEAPCCLVINAITCNHIIKRTRCLPKDRFKTKHRNLKTLDYLCFPSYSKNWGTVSVRSYCDIVLYSLSE